METSADVQINGPLGARYEEILTPAALAFLAELHRAADGRRRELLARRAAREAELAAGGMLDFLDETKDVREGDWQVAPPAPGLVDRRGEGFSPPAPRVKHKRHGSSAHAGAGPPTGDSTPPLAD